MKKWFVLALIAAVSTGVYAEDNADKAKKGEGKGGGITKEKYIAKQKKMAEKKGVEFDEAKVAKRFDKMDKNNDGKLTGDENPPKKKGKGKEKKPDEKKTD